MLKRDVEGYERPHHLVKLERGTFSCTLCKLIWQRRPQTFCAGVPVYHYGTWPEDLSTRTQLRRMKRWPRDLEQPDGAYFLRKSPYRRWLYRFSEARPWRTPTPRQAEAIRKMRAGLVQRYTCLRCGYYDRSHGKARYTQPLQAGRCEICWEEYYHWERQSEVCVWAQRYVTEDQFIVVDSETTGLEGEVIELAILEGRSGTVLFNSLVQPEQLVDHSTLATHIHGITHADLERAPRFPEVWSRVQAILRRYRRVLTYNAEFDYSRLKETAARYGFRLPGTPQGRDWECLIQQFARYQGAWSTYHQGWAWSTLASAAASLGVSRQGNAHRALSDAQTARSVIWAMAMKHGTIELAAPPKLERTAALGNGDEFP